jgi:hypothetical protein
MIGRPLFWKLAFFVQAATRPRLEPKAADMTNPELIGQGQACARR